MALAELHDEHVSNQGTKHLEQDTVQRFRVEVFDVEILLQLPTQNLDHCSKQVYTDHIDGVVC